jgi:type VI secretion system protein ImpA
LDIDDLLQPLSDEAPSGEDLEYDLEYGELERAAQGTAAHSMGDSTTEAVPPDWRTVREKALALFERTRDLRVAIHLTNAALDIEGFSGLRDGLKLVHGLSDTLWDTVFPQLDEDDGDPMMRCNAVRELVNREKLLAGVLDQPFVEARLAGRYCLRDLKIINGDMSMPEGDDRQPPSLTLIEAAFREVDAEQLEETKGLVEECAAIVADISSLYDDKTGADSPDISELETYLKDILQFLGSQMSKLGIGDAAEDDGWEDVGAGDSGVSTGASGGGAAISGDIRSSADVLRMIDKICDYYDRQEPSSPVPILLRRASSLVGKNFLDAITDLAPGAVSEVKHFQGSGGDAGSADDWSTPAAEDSETKTDDGW